MAPRRDTRKNDRRTASGPPPEPPPMGTERTLPHDLEAERAVLGSILVHSDAYDAAADILDEADFFRDAHRRIFRAMGNLADARREIDWLTLKEELSRRGDLEDVGGASYVMSLTDGIPRSANIEHYAAIVHEKSKLRGAIAASSKITALAYEAEIRSNELLADGAEQLYTLGAGDLEGRAVSIAELITPSMEALEKAVNAGGAITGLQTGFTRLDALTAGLQPSDFIIVAARTSQGKTALVMNIAQHVAIAEPTLIFSLEMSKHQLFSRLLSSDAKVDSHRLRTGLLEEDDWRRISQSLGRLSELKMFIDDKGGIGVREVRARARQIKAKHGLGLIVVDYVQLMKGRGTFDNRTQEIGTISRGLKAVARELNVPVIALSQLSRAAEPMPGRKARRPQLSDLSESASLENDADVCFLIYRPEPEQKDESDADNVAEIIVAKQRNGPVGIVKLHWNARYVRFENISLV